MSIPPAAGEHDVDTQESAAGVPPKRVRRVKVVLAIVLAAVVASTSVAVVLSGGGKTTPHRPPVASSSPPPSGSGPAAGAVAVPAGFPSAATTGDPTGISLKPYVGPSVITTNHASLVGVLVAGCLVVQADDVTIRNSKIVCKEARPAIAMLGSSEGTVVSHVEVDGANVATIGIELKNGVASDVNVYGAGDGVHLGSDATLEDSYIHDLGVQPNLHHDDLQTAKGSQASHIRVIHNTLLAYTSSKGDNSVYHVGSGAISDVLLEDNYIDGGHYSIEDTNEVGQRDIVIRGNHFGRHYHYGIILVGARNDAVSVVGNVWQDDGEPATEANSLGKGQATSAKSGTTPEGISEAATTARGEVRSPVAPVTPHPVAANG